MDQQICFIFWWHIVVGICSINFGTNIVEHILLNSIFLNPECMGGGGIIAISPVMLYYI
jgi:hypothetical protein